MLQEFRRIIPPFPIAIAAVLLIVGARVDAATVDCLDSEAALNYWRPIPEQMRTSEEPPDSLALELIPCLGSPAPELRDQIAYELFTYWLRNDRLTDETQRTLLVELSALMNQPPARVADNAALSRSFSALILAELMRSDAQKAFMDDKQRQTLLNHATAALERENDFRGFDVEMGWVHPVAHMSDLLWRFALHPETASAQAELILESVRTKVAPRTAFYTFNESDRLARVVSTVIRRRLVDTSYIVEWLATFESPLSMEDWSNAFASRPGMAELHNTKHFLRALADQLRSTETSAEIIERLEALVDDFTQMI
jgi:hypothetical protein